MWPLVMQRMLTLREVLQLPSWPFVIEYGEVAHDIIPTSGDIFSGLVIGAVFLQHHFIEVATRKYDQAFSPSVSKYSRVFKFTFRYFKIVHTMVEMPDEDGFGCLRRFAQLFARRCHLSSIGRNRIRLPPAAHPGNTGSCLVWEAD